MAPKSGPRSAPISGSARAGLVLAPARIRRILMRSLPGRKRVSNVSAVYLAGCLERLGVHLLEGAGDRCLKAKRKRVSGKDIGHVLRHDEDLRKTHLSQMLITGQWEQPEMRRTMLVAKPRV